MENLKFIDELLEKAEYIYVLGVKMQKELQRSKSSVLIHGQYAFTKYLSFLCFAGPVVMILHGCRFCCR